MSFSDRSHRMYSAKRKNLTLMVMSRSLNGICMITDPFDVLRTPIPCNISTSGVRMFLQKPKVSQYAEYWDLYIIEEVLAPVSILTPLNAVVDFLRAFRMLVIMPFLFSVTFKPLISAFDSNDDSIWDNSLSAMSPNGDISSAALYSCPSAKYIS